MGRKRRSKQNAWKDNNVIVDEDSQLLRVGLFVFSRGPARIEDGTEGNKLRCKAVYILLLVVLAILLLLCLSTERIRVKKEKEEPGKEV